jgi:predicted O-methyltransferase YrrM
MGKGAKATVEMATLIEQQPGCGPPAPVPVLQWEREMEVLLALYRRLQPRRVLEVGTYHGGTLFHWLQNAHWRPTIVSIDSCAVGVDNRLMYDEWNIHNAELVVIKGDSHKPRTFRQVRLQGPFDWVFIDAGHFLPEVTRDWEIYGPMVAPDGILFFHDILTHPAWPSIEVGQLWAKIKQTHRTFEIVHDRNAEWGGVGALLP